MNNDIYINLAYILSAVLFVIGLKKLSSPNSAKMGNGLSALAMLIAIVITLLDGDIVSYQWIIVGIAAGTLIGALLALFIPMTSMPEMVAVLNGFGGGAGALVASAELILDRGGAFPGYSVALYLTALIGSVTFTGSTVAFLKLAELIPGKSFVFTGQNIVNSILLITLLTLGVVFVGGFAPDQSIGIFSAVVALSLLFGIMIVVPIGGADMPVVISLLNSYSGIAAAAAGFLLMNTLLIVAGALVGASGIILTNIMCKAMNRSILNVLFSGFGSVKKSTPGVEVKGEMKPISVSDAYLILEAAMSVVIIPGYGMAVSQAQHAVKELADILEKNGSDVKYAIHPVAGRMPGHMNVLLAEANVSYDQLFEPGMINPTMETVDVCITIGANDVVNPAARTIPESPLYGMPVIEADRAKTVFVLKRSMATGFSGVDNPLFVLKNSRMIFGDAKSTVTGLIAEFKS